MIFSFFSINNQTRKDDLYLIFRLFSQTKAYNIKKYNYLAVNWHENNYRILYKLDYDPDTKEFSKEVLKLPLQGKRLMTLEERKPFLDSDLV